ncbi:MAG: fluoride efflux transporter CrcB [Parachlamydiales bacterium]|jgi:CrcB protein
MYLVFLVGIGGFIGAILRYWISGWAQSSFLSFPFGTLAVNFIGSFFLGLIMYLAEYRGCFSDQSRIFLTIGVLGAFTTMSTFNYESFKLLEQNELFLFGANLAGTLVLTFLAVYFGKVLALSFSGG